MATLSSLVSAIDKIIKDDSYDLVSCINEAVNTIAGGIRMPDGSTSPPLPDLYKSDTVATTGLAYVSLPTDYQRNVFNVFDTSWNKIEPVRGGGYYSFNLFLKQISNLSLAETGSIYAVCIKGLKLYYQGIPSAAANIGLHYYRKPVAMALDGDTPDGIPDHLAGDLIKHWVIKEIMGEQLEAGVTEPSRGFEYHTRRFYERMNDMCDYVGQDGEPQYYGTDADYDYFGSM
jgi:hypothetical protein